MSANVKTTELVDAVIDLLVSKIGTTITFAPKLVQEGDLSFYIEAGTLTDDIPAIFVQSPNVDLAPLDVTANIWVFNTQVRMVVVRSWDHGDDVVDARQNTGSEVAQVFIGGSGDSYDLGASIAGHTVTTAIPKTIELDPPESAAVSLVEERQLYAVAVTLLIESRSSRT